MPSERGEGGDADNATTEQWEERGKRRAATAVQGGFRDDTFIQMTIAEAAIETAKDALDKES